MNYFNQAGADSGLGREGMPGDDGMSKMLMDLAMKKKQAEGEEGGGLWNLLGPVGNLVGQTMDGREGINWGNVGNSAANSAMLAAGAATGNPALIGQGVSGTMKSI